MNDEVEPSTSSSPTKPAAAATATKDQIFLRARREPFEHGLLPISKLIFSDGTATLGPLKEKLIERSSSLRIDAEGVAEVLQISIDNAGLVLDTLAAVRPSDSDPLVVDEISGVVVGADVYDLILFLYIQSYRRLLPRSHKDSAAVADVWPSTSVFDGFLSALSPLQLVRSNSRRFIPSQADEEAHQLSYLQKHLANILSLLAESVEGEEEESLVMTLERFERLSFLFQFGEKGSDGVSLSQAAPFFANSDPDMPAVHVSATQVHDWILQNITAALEHTAERVPPKENGPSSIGDQDVSMTDASTGSYKGSGTKSISFVEGISKASLVKKASDLKGSSVKVLNCHDSVIYVLAPLRYATVYGCSDATIVLGAIGKAVRVEHCERVQVVVAARRICIANCRECVFYLGVNQRPLILGDNHKLQIPNWFGGESANPTTINPFPLPEAYMTSQQKNHQSLGEIKQALRDLQLEENRKREISSALHVYFKDWLYASGNVRQLYCLQGD
ncbi:hypothetical protein Sjap_002444 [Stephania japonica]|uniref:TBCC domain-containing protein 1 n=1 Tax=Stephania japonica TaxID=461633 RepID=A0AAP0KP80_9MAGN